MRADQKVTAGHPSTSSPTDTLLLDSIRLKASPYLDSAPDEIVRRVARFVLDNDHMFGQVITEKVYYGPCPICEQAKRLNDDALGEASWKLMECAGPGIPFNRLKDISREVVTAYFASIERQAGLK